MKRIYFTVTNDLVYDQRMHRICTSLANAGFDVWLVGRKRSRSVAIQQTPFRTARLRCLFNKGIWFYAEYNLRLFFFLLFKRMDGICAIDLDTIIPCYFISKLRGIKRIYDAHEYFTELKEVRTRPLVRKIWMAIEKFAVPRFHAGYTVSEGLAEEFLRRYQRSYLVIRNLPVLIDSLPGNTKEKKIIFQGAVNEARGFEHLIPAMRFVDYPLIICGDGNFMIQLKTLISENKVEHKVELKGMMLPADLRKEASKAMIGIGLAEKEGVNQFNALPNKFLEYMHAGLPQVAMAFPEYEKINRHYEIAVLIDDLSPELVADTINNMMRNETLLARLRENALAAREVYCWQNEEQLLIGFYKKIFNLE